eukprot:scaffold143676_cov48-Attheya_sp.AAC.1
MTFNPRDDDALVVELPEEMIYHISSFLDVATLVQKKPVCRLWRELCTTAIDKKAPIPRTAFETNDELRAAVKKYTMYKADDADEFASTYGWPMDKWDVSRGLRGLKSGLCNQTFRLVPEFGSQTFVLVLCHFIGLYYLTVTAIFSTEKGIRFDQTRKDGRGSSLLG